MRERKLLGYLHKASDIARFVFKKIICKLSEVLGLLCVSCLGEASSCLGQHITRAARIHRWVTVSLVFLKEFCPRRLGVTLPRGWVSALLNQEHVSHARGFPQAVLLWGFVGCHGKWNEKGNKGGIEDLLSRTDVYW